MTATEQIKALIKVGCESAVREIRCNHNQPLSSNRLQYHIEKSIDKGYVLHAITLAQLNGRPLAPTQLSRLIWRCLELEWIVDALHAAMQGVIPKNTRQKLIRALIEHKLVDDEKEAAILLRNTE